MNRPPDVTLWESRPEADCQMTEPFTEATPEVGLLPRSQSGRASHAGNDIGSGLDPHGCP